MKSCNGAQQGGFACAVSACEGGEGARRECASEVFGHNVFVVTNCQVAKVEQMSWHGAWCVGCIENGRGLVLFLDAAPCHRCVCFFGSEAYFYGFALSVFHGYFQQEQWALSLCRTEAVALCAFQRAPLKVE